MNSSTVGAEEGALALEWSARDWDSRAGRWTGSFLIVNLVALASCGVWIFFALPQKRVIVLMEAGIYSPFLLHLIIENRRWRRYVIAPKFFQIRQTPHERRLNPERIWRMDVRRDRIVFDVGGGVFNRPYAILPTDEDQRQHVLNRVHEFRQEVLRDRVAKLA